MANLVELAEKILAERGADYQERWLRRYLAQQENEDAFMAELLKKQLSESVKAKPKAKMPEKIQ